MDPDILDPHISPSIRARLLGIAPAPIPLPPSPEITPVISGQKISMSPSIAVNEPENENLALRPYKLRAFDSQVKQIRHDSHGLR